MTEHSAQTPPRTPPEILAPAGDIDSFLAALAAGADAVYVGLKHFSARMQAENFSLTELSRLTDLAHAEQRRVYVTMNTLLKPSEIKAAYRLLVRLVRQARPDGLIIQDMGMLDLARQAGFEKGLFLSTLANVTHPRALIAARCCGADRVILPRELSIDEIRMMDAACPDGLNLECFVHGALCYCVSGRCWWSSYMGGKSGLRGYCVQPCRRLYSQGISAVRRHEHKRIPEDIYHHERRKASGGKGREGRFFSCLDLSLDVLTKTLLGMRRLVSWKIEGRKKGPYYVYHVVTAYRMLRADASDPKARKMAQELLQMALGRPLTRANFLPAKERVPTDPGGQTSSGLLAGKINMTQNRSVLLKPHFDLLPGDCLRVGVEDETWHATLPVTRRVPKAGTLTLRTAKHKTPKNGTPVFLIDRRDPQLAAAIASWQAKLREVQGRPAKAVDASPRLSMPVRSAPQPDMLLRASVPRGRETRFSRKFETALWLSLRSAALSRTVVSRVVWWLPPVVWPEEEDSLARRIEHLRRDGARRFVCNAPWQRCFFPDQSDSVQLLAGPFCGAANAAALGVLRKMGFAAAFVSLELARDDLLALPRQSPLPLGLVLTGFWPVGISRFGLLGIKTDMPFVSPKGEMFWARRYGANIWLYPGWPLDLTEKRKELVDAGYSFFAHIEEHTPHGLPESRRQAFFNYDGQLL
ncbi:peptidase U32 family protein [Candidatus Desulfovibrio trichonymphae]|uniref:U32 family peptidase n=1 Tax=Candidatus Desulfovibrio trichonymphae TaxID=1725232 RepID=A0A1J1DQX2_9BACT|nr:U32 family peptidase [Candidatus Desulfovibrio trichonymphae]BAV92218.1 U32 family peptidase [Candidatus Desulfovibrio trichonymphae]GHU99036.1 peptidase U32 [Deltaproteobacteria bacterium]